jgi:hypothetical protein
MATSMLYERLTQACGSPDSVIQLKAQKWLDSLETVGLTMFVFGSLAWLYVVAVQITHPEWLPLTLTHYKIAPFDWRVDNVGILGFAIAAFGFFVCRLAKDTRTNSTRKPQG